MSEQESTAAAQTGPAEGPGELDTALRQLIDIDGRAMAIAKRVEQTVNDPKASPAFRQKLIESMNQVVTSSDTVHRFIKETLAPSLARRTPEASTEPSPPARRRPKKPQVRL